MMVAVDGRTARRLATRSRLLQEARRLVETRGAANVSMNDLASAAGVTRRTVYDHFGSRAGLLVSLAEQADRDIDLAERLGPVFTAPTGTAAIGELVAVVADVTPPLLELATAIERARHVDPDADAAWTDRMNNRIRSCRQLAQQLHDDDDLRPDLTVHEAADLIYTAISWQAWDLLVTERGWSPQQWVQRTRDLLLRALTP